MSDHAKTKYRTLTGEICEMPGGCDWRARVQVSIVAPDGEENWSLDWMGPKMDFISNVKHNYLLLEYLFGRDPETENPAVFENIKKILDADQLIE